MTVRTRPTYEARPTFYRQVSGKVIRIKNNFDIYEYQDGKENHICRLSNRGDRLNNILKRGIPMDDAKKVFYQMDEA